MEKFDGKKDCRCDRISMRCLALFFWLGLPPNHSLARPFYTPNVSVNLFALTGE